MGLITIPQFHEIEWMMQKVRLINPINQPTNCLVLLGRNGGPVWINGGM